MNDIAELERRITLALERIGAGIDMLGTTGGGTAAASDDSAGADSHIAELEDALEAERAANAQLTERVRAIREKQETMVSALERKVARLTEQADSATLELQRLRQINEDLSDANRALSLAVAEGVSEPELINHAMMSELEALRASRAADLAEMDDILSELKPLIGEVA
jgi:chromosome segregation ATPase